MQFFKIISMEKVHVWAALTDVGDDLSTFNQIFFRMLFNKCVLAWYLWHYLSWSRITDHKFQSQMVRRNEGNPVVLRTKMRSGELDSDRLHEPLWFGPAWSGEAIVGEGLIKN